MSHEIRSNQEVLSEALLCFGATSVTVDDIAGAGYLDEVSDCFFVRQCMYIYNFHDHYTVKMIFLQLLGIIRVCTKC